MRNILKKRIPKLWLKNAKIDKCSSSVIYIKNRLVLGDKHKRGYKRSTLLRMGRKSELCLGFIMDVIYKYLMAGDWSWVQVFVIQIQKSDVRIKSVLDMTLQLHMMC